MEILIEGDQKMVLKPKRFSCRECGCLFEATIAEYEHGTQREPECWCSCPSCGGIVYEMR